MKAIQQGESFLVSSRFIPLSPTTNMSGVFNNRILPATYSWQQRAMAIACVILDASGAFLTYNS